MRAAFLKSNKKRAAEIVADELARHERKKRKPQEEFALEEEPQAEDGPNCPQ